MIQSVVRAAQILKALGGDTPRLGVTELAERVGLAKGTVHGLLRTLEDEGLVEQDAETGKYQLGMEIFQLGNMVLEHHAPARRRGLLDGPLDRLTGRTITDRADLADALYSVKVAALAVEDQEAIV